MISKPPQDVLRHVVDVHCHPTDSEIRDVVVEEMSITICAMATKPDDQALVAELANKFPTKVIPCFGYHPWFTHWISVNADINISKEDHYRSLFLGPNTETSNSSEDIDKKSLILDEMLPHLPDPVRLDDLLRSLRQRFEDYPDAMLGEVGLDRSARIPIDYHAAQRKLSPFTIPFDHQLAILEAQMSIAVEMRRNISLHSVKSHQATVDLLKRMKTKYGRKWTNISVDLHSCGLSPETWKEIENSHINVFLSLSSMINGRSPNHRKLIEVASPDRLLAESDIHDINQCTDLTWEMMLTMSEIKKWKIEERWEEDLREEEWGAVHRLEANFNRFRRGYHRESIVTGHKKYK